MWGCSFHATVRADSRFMPSQRETSLQSNAVSHWLGANLESALLLWIWCDISENVHVFRPTLFISAMLQFLCLQGPKFDADTVCPYHLCDVTTISAITFTINMLFQSRLFQTKPIPESMLTYCQPNFSDILFKIWNFMSRKYIKIVFCKMATILIKHQCVKTKPIQWIGYTETYSLDIHDCMINMIVEFPLFATHIAQCFHILRSWGQSGPPHAPFRNRCILPWSSRKCPGVSNYQKIDFVCRTACSG